MGEPDFWDEPERARKLIASITASRSVVGEWDRLASELDDLGVLVELAEEEGDEATASEAVDMAARLDREVEACELKSFLSGEYDHHGAIVEINAGAGGTESQDWAAMLLRLYRRWAERREFKTEIIESQEGQEAGLKSVLMEVSGSFAYGYLRQEIGVHRLVRISPFDAQKRRHTSFASVMVLPRLDDDVTVEIEPDDLKIDTYRASGAGGQHVNKTESAIRITHLPTNTVVTCQSERSQHRNRESAMKILQARLTVLRMEEENQKRDALAGEKKKIEWGSQIRSYTLQPYTLVKDHRTNAETGNVQAVMDGDIDMFIDAALRESREREVGS
jgi:peptide chain release factor 2